MIILKIIKCLQILLIPIKRIPVKVLVYLILSILILYHLFSSNGKSKKYIEFKYPEEIAYPPPCRSNTFLVVLITSKSTNSKFRSLSRSLLPSSELETIHIKRIFLLGLPPPSKDRKKEINDILQEATDYNDVLLGDFEESYRNLSYKHLMGLKWAGEECSKAHFVLKQDDDVIVDYFHLHVMFHEKKSDILGKVLTRKIILGKMLTNMKPMRAPTSKWFVKEEEWAKEEYPNFVSGWAYLTTPKVVKLIAESALNEGYFWIDDVLVTGKLRENVGVELIDLHEMFTVFKGHMLCCVNEKWRKKNGQNFWCDFLVGPSNGDYELMRRSFDYSRKCFHSKNCQRRKDNEALNNTCVITKEDVQENEKNLIVKGTLIKTNL